MPSRRVPAGSVPAPILAGLQQLNDTLDIPGDFPSDVLAAAAAAAMAPRLPALDLTGIEFVTIDPEGSMDLDQAVHVARSGAGYEVHYAIADVAAWVAPDGAVDMEARKRGQTYYAPAQRTPLHPSALSEAAASLLADGTPRPAQVWTLTLDAAGALLDARVERAMVLNRERLSYVSVQKALDDGTASESLQLLKTVGLLREAAEAARGGVSLNLPEQEITVEGDVWTLHFREPLPVEGWNAQISLLTGAAAAQIMLRGKVGILRTLPSAEQYGIDRLRHVAKGLRIPWPGSMTYPEFVRSLDPTVPAHQAMMNACTLLFRGAGYLAFDGELPEGNLQHAALAMEYAHVTAPLRRLVDRFVGETCLALCAGVAVPSWVREALPTLPGIMQESDTRAKKYDRGIVDLLESLVLSCHVGETFTATVIESDPEKGSGVILLAVPAVESPMKGVNLPLGEGIFVRLLAVDLVLGRVSFAAV